jgi:hypothetical protein
MQRQETYVDTECVGCGVTFQQRDDAGRKREYHSRACRQRAYRARSGRDGHEARREQREQRRRAHEGARQRMYEEAFGEREAQRERERQRSHERRYGFPPPPPDTIPGWCTSQPASDTKQQAKYRRWAYLLYVKATHPTADPFEAAACRETAESYRATYRL